MTNTTNYFTFCKTAEDVKQLYKNLVKKLHPDLNRDRDTTADFQAMQNEYETAWNRLKNVHVNASGEQYTKETTEDAKEYMDLIEKLIKLDGVNVELCGAWLWLTGDTKTHKDIIKELGFKWAGKKAAWYYHRDPWHKKASKMTMDDIRNKYGSIYFGSKKEQEAEKAAALAC